MQIASITLIIVDGVVLEVNLIVFLVLPLDLPLPLALVLVANGVLVTLDALLQIVLLPVLLVTVFVENVSVPLDMEDHL